MNKIKSNKKERNLKTGDYASNSTDQLRKYWVTNAEATL